MGVPIIHQPFCKICSRVKGKTNGWFLVRIVDREFCFRDYDEYLLRHYDFVVCGAEHLDKVHREHVERLLGIRSGGAGSLPPSNVRTDSAEPVLSR